MDINYKLKDDHIYYYMILLIYSRRSQCVLDGWVRVEMNGVGVVN